MSKESKNGGKDNSFSIFGKGGEKGSKTVLKPPKPLGTEKVVEDPTSFWALQEKLGEGQYGKVFRGISKKDGKEYAVKIIRVAEEVPFEREIEVMKKCSHKNIVKYHDSFYHPEEDSLWIILEFCHLGSVDVVVKILELEFNEMQLASIVASTLRGLVYLHSLKQIHRDIKAGNIMVSNKGSIKIGDFGISVSLTKSMTKRFTFIGTPYWMSKYNFYLQFFSTIIGPEVIQRGTAYGEKADIWSLGITTIELGDGHPPLVHLPPMKALFKIPFLPPPTFKNPSKWSKNARDFVSKCLEKEPKERPTAKELLNHPWIKNAPDPEKVLLPVVERVNAKISEGGGRKIFMEKFLKELRSKQEKTYDSEDDSDSDYETDSGSDGDSESGSDSEDSEDSKTLKYTKPEEKKTEIIRPIKKKEMIDSNKKNVLKNTPVGMPPRSPVSSKKKIEKAPKPKIVVTQEKKVVKKNRVSAVYKKSKGRGLVPDKKRVIGVRRSERVPSSMPKIRSRKNVRKSTLSDKKSSSNEIQKELRKRTLGKKIIADGFVKLIKSYGKSENNIIENELYDSSLKEVGEYVVKKVKDLVITGEYEAIEHHLNIFDQIRNKWFLSNLKSYTSFCSYVEQNFSNIRNMKNFYKKKIKIFKNEKIEKTFKSKAKVFNGKLKKFKKKKKFEREKFNKLFEEFNKYENSFKVYVRTLESLENDINNYYEKNASLIDPCFEQMKKEFVKLKTTRGEHINNYTKALLVSMKVDKMKKRMNLLMFKYKKRFCTQMIKQKLALQMEFETSKKFFEVIINSTAEKLSKKKK